MSDVFAIALILSGLALLIAGNIGLLRLPDVYSRLHALAKPDNVDSGLHVLGLNILISNVLTAAKPIFVPILIPAYNTASAHIVARSARHSYRERGECKP